MIIALLMHQHTGFGDDFFMFSKDKTECNKAQRAFPVTSAAQGPPAGDLPMENPDPHQQFSASAFNWNVSVPGAGGQHAAPNNNQDATLSQQIPVAALKKAPVPKMRASPPMIQETVSLDFHQRQLPTNVTSMDQGQQKAEKPISPHSKKALTPLPADFEPSPFSVLCGQGNENYNAVGNRRFRVTAGMFLERYKEAADRQQKSAIVKIVLEIIRQSCPVGAFIKYKDGHWWEVSEQTAREKVSLRQVLACVLLHVSFLQNAQCTGHVTQNWFLFCCDYR